MLRRKLMYGSNNAYASANNTYMNNQVMTASRTKLVVMLYDGAIRNLKLAKLAIEDNNIEKKNTCIIKAQQILSEFMGTLNMEDGGEIAKNLMALYQYMYQRTIRANIDKDQGILDEVIGYLEELRDAWNQI
jgi:flagellar secretion chaperone FliS